MKKLNKILLFAISLIGLVFSIGLLSLFYPIQPAADMIISFLSPYLRLHDIFAGYIVFIGLCFLLLMIIALFSPGQYNDMVLAKDKGKLRFSKQTVESTVRYSFADVGGINFSKVRIKLGGQPEKIKIYVRLSLNDPNGLVDLTQTVQNKIEAALESSLGVAAKSIDIKVVALSPGDRVQKENSEDTVTTGRVI